MSNRNNTVTSSKPYQSCPVVLILSHYLIDTVPDEYTEANPHAVRSSRLSGMYTRVSASTE
jgi:hypothetical protein